jgi:hypothetical protein
MHSVKRGALKQLSHLAAEGQIPTDLLSTMAKHKKPVPVIAPQTVGYIDDSLSVALAMKTHLATTALARALFPKKFRKRVTPS